MRSLYVVMILFLTGSAFGQFKPNLSGTAGASGRHYTVQDIQPLHSIRPEVPSGTGIFAGAARAGLDQLLVSPRPLVIPQQGLEIRRAPDTGLPIFIKGNLTLPEIGFRDKPAEVWPAFAYLDALKKTLLLRQPADEFSVASVEEDDLGLQHIRLQQMYRGLEVYGAELIVHLRDGEPYLLNGRYYPTPALSDLQPALTRVQALSKAFADVTRYTTVHALSPAELDLLDGPAEEEKLVVYHPGGRPEDARLAWALNIVPSLGRRWAYFVDARTGDVLDHYSLVCRFRAVPESACPRACPSPVPVSPSTAPVPLPADGPRTAVAKDLFGTSRTLNTYELQGGFWLIDAGRPMYNAARSTLPNEAVGGIITVDARGSSPENDDFGAFFITSGNNTWTDPKAVSAHYNAGQAYEYFRTTYNRNSINGQGGTIYSIINVTESDGSEMDNAFWDGRAMYYGNGNQAFTPLAKALDVAGHEMSHGVIQSTAGLEYQGESGALNESYADVFGVMIDRDDWRLGEDVTKTSAFPTGALRDMADPHNGGSSLNDPGWQPAHTNEQYTGSGDNGGVHINSGIPNRAFYLFATAVGKDVAEQVYYTALTDYLVRSSQFVDMRLAVLQAADARYPGNAAVKNAAAQAFDAVGIGNGQGGDYEQDIDLNPGQDFVLFSDQDHSGLKIILPNGQSVADPLVTDDLLSKPSVTDDGTAIVYIAADKTMKAVLIDWQQLRVSQLVLSNQPIWRNVAISKDGNRLAALTDDYDNSLYIFDLTKSPTPSQGYQLYNPTYTEGVQTGTVQYADALEWSYDGDFLMYDALNSVNSSQGAIEYWDINFLRAWDGQGSSFGDGQVFKLFNSLPDNVSVGNATFAKNSPYVIAFDLLDESTEEYYIFGSNIESGDVGVIWQNLTLGYPSFSSDDQRLLFDGQAAQSGNAVLAVVDLESDKINGTEQAVILVNNASWGVWFANGDRNTTTSVEPALLDGKPVLLYPNPFGEELTVGLDLAQPGTVQLELFDAMGHRLHAESVGAPAGVWQHQFRASGLPAGAYLLRLSVEGQSVSRTVVRF